MTLFAVVALAATAAFLALGIGAMVRGGAYDRDHSTRYMSLRVAAQGAALLFVVLALLTSVH